MSIIIIDDRQSIKFDLVLLQQFDSFHHPGKRTSSSFIFTITVMHMFGSIDRNTDKKIILFKETTPLIIEQNSIGLYRVSDRTTFCITFLQSNGLSEKIETPQQRFTTVPCKQNFRCSLTIDIFLCKFFQHFICHPIRPLPPVKFTFLQIVTIAAIEITHRSYRFCHNIYRIIQRIIRNCFSHVDSSSLKGQRY